MKKYILAAVVAVLVIGSVIFNAMKGEEVAEATPAVEQVKEAK